MTEQYTSRQYEISMADGETTSAIGTHWRIEDGGALVVYKQNSLYVNESIIGFGPGQWRMIYGMD